MPSDGIRQTPVPTPGRTSAVPGGKALACVQERALPLLLSIVLLWLAGCASQPYPPLPEDLSAPVRQPAAAASIEAVSAERPFPQDVEPPPPDPDGLPAAEERQLDIRLGPQRFRYFEDDRLVWSGVISAGTAEHPTPEGSYRVQSKQRHKRSGSYTNAFDQPTPMPYALQFRGPYYVHEGYVTGRPESHGCVRLRYHDARFLFARMQPGDHIVIAD
jgi:hypothetical protein